MRTLIIMRHAKSGWKGTELSDFDRPLKKRGEADAPMMGEFLREHDLTPSLIISSSAKRARSTAKRVAESCGYSGEVRYTESLYLAPARGYIRELNDLAAEEDGAHHLSSVMVIGHNPGLEDLVYALTGKAPALPTAAVAVVDLNISSWDQLDHAARYPGTLRALYRPRELCEPDGSAEPAP